MIGVLISCYDHVSTVARPVEALAPTGLPCLRLDDGSGRATREALDGLAKQLPVVALPMRVVYLPGGLAHLLRRQARAARRGSPR